MQDPKPLQPLNTKLTIYSRSAHIVQKWPKDTTSIMLPKSTDISSIVAIDLNGKILPFSYIPPTDLYGSLTHRNTGEKVSAAVIKNGEIIKGDIVSMDSDNIILTSNNGLINIRHYDQVSISTKYNGSRPHLNLDKTTVPLTLSYIVSDISWSCIGTALIDDKAHMLYLRFSGWIINNLESDIQAQVALVSGHVNQGHKTRHMESAMATFSAPMSSPQVNMGLLEDYVKYDIGQKLIRNQNMVELGTWSFSVDKLYVHNTQDANTVTFGYRFTAPDFIPMSTINVYAIDSEQNIDSYLGTQNIDESQKGDDVDLILGQTTLLKCKSTVLPTDDFVVSDLATARKYNLPIESKSEGQALHVTTEMLNVELENRTGTNIILLLKHYIGSKSLVNIKCPQAPTRQQGFLEWYIKLAPQTKTGILTFSCEIVTAGFR